jgi:acetylornithine deacetylase/succinyl-diaminopimelate desuccinylase-like protein
VDGRRDPRRRRGADRVFGAGGEGAHAAEEWVDLDDVERCARALAGVAAAWCA